MKRTIVAWMLLAFAAGCTSTYTEPALPSDHPASAGAAKAPPPPRSRTLDLAEAGTVAPEQPAMDHPAQAHATTTASASALYACPMHPEVTSDKPDQRCPKCGMKLKKAEASSGGPR